MMKKENWISFNKADSKTHPENGYYLVQTKNDSVFLNKYEDRWLVCNETVIAYQKIELYDGHKKNL